MAEQKSQKVSRHRVGHWAATIAIITVAVCIGFFLHWLVMPSPGPAVGGANRAAAGPPQVEQVWTCSMHPSVRQPGPGLCPICNMELIPVVAEPGGVSDDERVLSVSPTAAALMNVETAPVERRFVTAKVRMVGMVRYDETRLAEIAAWVPGRLDRLYVDYTGAPVRQGDRMVDLFSPDLLTAQEELLQAERAVRQLSPSTSDLLRASLKAGAEAAREKLRLLGLTADQIEEILARGEARDTVTLKAPAGGIVVERSAQQGQYVDTGATIYRIADLSTVWVILEAYESDLAWLRYGQPVTFSTVSVPGRVFEGMISFIDPIVDVRTRTARIRVNAPNSDGVLKPGMYVSATVKSQLAVEGKVIEPSLAGKWVSPMHPEIIKDEPGLCDVCGMPLVKAESLGYVSAEPTQAPLVIPVSAPLMVGSEALVYVDIGTAEAPAFEMRRVTLGPRAGDFYLVEAGLAEGERVVSRGAFLIDSDRQIRGLPSMMGPMADGEAVRMEESTGTTAAPDLLADQLQPVYEAYYGLSNALSDDDESAARTALTELAGALAAVEADNLEPDQAERWTAESATLGRLLDDAALTDGIEPLRASFALVSEQTLSIARAFGTRQPIQELMCPMAFNNRGATWLQPDDDVRNPYFGASMLRCGGVTDTVEPSGTGVENHQH